jgi:predicted aspartyl protease
MGNQVQATLLLDTGAEMTVIYRQITDQLNMPLTGGAKVRVGGGSVLNAGVVKFDYVRVGPYEAKGMQAWVMSPKGPPGKEDGALGMNFLRGLEYSIDFENQVIRWKP